MAEAINVTEAQSEKALDSDDVAFDANAIAAAWEAADSQTPVCVAVALTNEFTEYTVNASEGVAEDRDVHFQNSGILVEEKAVGVCARETAEKYAPKYVTLPGRDKVLAVNPAQIMPGFDY
jgi:hypothetical protein